MAFSESIPAGILASVDPSGKALAVAATVIGIGLAIGPAAVVLVMGGGDYGAILWLAGALAILSLVLMLQPLRANLLPTVATEPMRMRSDVTALEAARESIAKRYADRRITSVAFHVKAVCATLKEFPG